MKKIVICRCYGGFSFSEEAIEMLNALGVNPNKVRFNVIRDDPRLIDVVEKLGGEKAIKNGRDGNCLRVVSIPEDVDWTIKDYDGREWVAEKHRTWRGEEDD